MPWRCASRWAARRLGELLAIAAVVAAQSCADTADGPLVIERIEDADDAPATTTTSALPELPRSEGTAEIGETRYDFSVTCNELGASEVTVVGLAEDPSGGRVELYLQAFPTDPYVGLRLADGTLIEPSLDSDLDFYVQDDVIRASAIRFVRDLDLDTGDATDVGFGEFEIHCRSYERSPPSS